MEIAYQRPSFHLKNKLFGQYCCAFYGSQLWPLWNKRFDNVCTQWRKAIRNVWNLPYRAHCDMLPIIADTYPLDIALECRFIKFVITVINSENELVTYLADKIKNNCNSTFGHNLRHLIVKYDLTLNDYISVPIGKIKMHFTRNGYQI